MKPIEQVERDAFRQFKRGPQPMLPSFTTCAAAALAFGALMSCAFGIAA